jgi:hypothetical protein
MYFYYITGVYEAYIDNALIFRDYPVDVIPTRLIKGLNRHEILVLEKSHHGKTLYLRIASGWKAIGIAGTPLLGNAKDLLFYNLQSYFHVGLLGIL